MGLFLGNYQGRLQLQCPPTMAQICNLCPSQKGWNLSVDVA